MRDATGTDEPLLQQRMLLQTLDASWLDRGESFEEAATATVAALAAIAPRDGMESMLATQMVAVHEAAMECFRRGMVSSQSPEVREINLKQAGKLLQIYTRQVGAFDKHRYRGQQRITVEHVHVHAGGQAIVGNVRAPVATNSASFVAPSTQIEHSTATANPADLSALGTGEAKRRVRRREK
jgi:hypothetical protein